MRIEHIAVWTEDLERLASFYRTYFGAAVGDKYANATKGFESRFLSFDVGPRLEIMRTTTLSPVKYQSAAQRMGLTHIAVSVGSEQGVDELTSRLRLDGYPIQSWTGLAGLVMGTTRVWCSIQMGIASKSPFKR